MVERKGKRIREAPNIWLRKPDVYRRLKRPSCAPAAAAPVEGAHVAPHATSVAAFEAEASDALQQLEAEVAAACAALGADADEGRLDVSGLRLPQLPNPRDELSYLNSLDPQQLLGRRAPPPAAGAGPWPGDAHGAGGRAPPPPRARARHPEGHAFQAADRQQEEARSVAAQLLHSVREARELKASVRLPQPPPVRMMPPRWGGGPRPAVASGAVPGDCVVITVAVCQARHDHKHVMTEMQLLGSCTLADLRDAIRCPTDAMAASAGAAAPSAYAWIDGRFYSDGRDARAADAGAEVAAFCREANVTVPLRLWAAPKPAQAGAAGAEEGAAGTAEGPAGNGGEAGGGGGSEGDDAGVGGSSGRMEQVRLADLDLAVANRPTYLYCHQGCCEHGWFVTDIRLRHPLDPPPAPGNYPRVLFRAPPPPAWRCGVCGKARAVAVAPHHPAAPEAPCLLCAGCRDLLLPPGGQARAAGAAGGGAGRGEVYSLL